MPGKYLLDTNVVIAVLNGAPPIVAWLSKKKTVYIPVITIAELYFGAYKSSRPAENIKKLEVFFATAPVLQCDVTTAREYGMIKAELKKRGTPIPENDLWIASIARQYGLTLATEDDHFRHVRMIRKEFLKIKT